MTFVCFQNDNNSLAHPVYYAGAASAAAAAAAAAAATADGAAATATAAASPAKLSVCGHRGFRREFYTASFEVRVN